MESIKKVFKEATRASIGWAAVMILLGILAVIMPRASGIAVSVLVSWIIVLGGLVHFASAFTGRNAGAFIWRMMIGIVYILGGGYLALHPKIALESLTVALAVIFVMEGVLEITAFLLLRVFPGSGWILLHALIALLLAYMIALPWPASSTWAIGIVLGINLIFSGVSVLMYVSAARKALGLLNSREENQQC